MLLSELFFSVLLSGSFFRFFFLGSSFRFFFPSSSFRTVSLPLLPLHLEARALLCPFHGFHLAVAVEVGAQVAMSHHLGAGIVQQQRPDEDAERMALPLGASVFGHAVVVQTALITDAY